MKYTGNIIGFLFVLMCISDPAFAMLSRFAAMKHGIPRTLGVVLNQAIAHEFNPTFALSHHNFSTTKEEEFGPHPTTHEGCIFKPQKSTSHTISADNPFHDICFDFQKLSAEISVGFFAEDVFEAKLAERIKTNKKVIFLEFEKVKKARELNDPTSNIMCGSLKQDAYDVWQINTSTYDHRRLMFPTLKYLLSLCYHFPNFCFLTKHDIKDLYVSLIKDIIEKHPYTTHVEIFTLLGKSKIPTHALTAIDFDECLKKADSRDEIRKEELRGLFKSIASHNRSAA